MSLVASCCVLLPHLSPAVAHTRCPSGFPAVCQRHPAASAHPVLLRPLRVVPVAAVFCVPTRSGRIPMARLLVRPHRAHPRRPADRSPSNGGCSSSLLCPCSGFTVRRPAGSVESCRRTWRVTPGRPRVAGAQDAWRALRRRGATARGRRRGSRETAAGRVAWHALVGCADRCSCAERPPWRRSRCPTMGRHYAIAHQAATG